MGLLEPHAGHGGGDDERRLTAPAGPAVVVHDLDHARATLAAAERAGRPVTLLSPAGAAATLGPLVFREIVAAARADVPNAASLAILDCGDAAGLALAAVRAGVEAASVDAAADVRARVVEIATAAGVRLLPRPRADLDLDGVERPDESLDALFASS